MTLCPETMGKIGQLGTLDEVLALCSVDKRIMPCIDFGHLNARTLGGIRSKEDYAAILDRMAEKLGDQRQNGSMCIFPHRVFGGRRKAPLDLCRDPVRPGAAAADGTAG